MRSHFTASTVERVATLSASAARLKFSKFSTSTPRPPRKKSRASKRKEAPQQRSAELDPDRLLCLPSSVRLDFPFFLLPNSGFFFLGTFFVALLGQPEKLDCRFGVEKFCESWWEEPLLLVLLLSVLSRAYVHAAEKQTLLSINIASHRITSATSLETALCCALPCLAPFGPIMPSKVATSNATPAKAKASAKRLLRHLRSMLSTPSQTRNDDASVPPAMPMSPRPPPRLPHLQLPKRLSLATASLRPSVHSVLSATTSLSLFRPDSEAKTPPRPTSMSSPAWATAGPCGTQRG